MLMYNLQWQERVRIKRRLIDLAHALPSATKFVLTHCPLYIEPVKYDNAHIERRFNRFELST